MKNCRYCGRNNDHEAAYCCGCGTEFVTPPTVAISTGGELQTDAPAAPTADFTTAPGQQWRASDGWKCLGIFVIFEMLLILWARGLAGWFPHFRSWQYTGVGYFATALVHYGVEIGTVLYFARIGSWAAFLRAFGLNAPPSSYVWFGVTATLAIRGFGHVMITSGLAHGVTTTDQLGFRHSVGLQRLFFSAVSLLLAPIFEELCMRGFFYRAFRGSYSVVFSTGLILGLAALTHFNQFRQSWVAGVGISALTLVQCFLRERGNLRDSMIVHFVFNGSAVILNSLRAH